jgi:cysteine desulfurase / selenocysteine lyase
VGEATGATEPLDVRRIRREFPALAQEVYGKPLVYLDNAATVQKPAAVLAATERFYREENANVRRGVHALSARATEAYNAARTAVQRFVNAADEQEIVFTRGTTEGINLVANSWGRANLREGDEVLVSAMEHHSNIVPWQMVCAQTGARLRVAPINGSGELLLDELSTLIGPRTRLVSLVHVSNALGTVNAVRDVIRLAREHGALVLLDGAQATPHFPLDVRALECDFYAFSGHKVYGPTGIGVLYGKAAHLEAMPPWQGGGDMVRTVSFDATTYEEPPFRFEAGTPNVAGAVGLAAAMRWLEGIGRERVATHEQDLLAYGTERLAEVPGLRLVGTAREKAAILSFVIEGIHPHDIATCVDREGIAIRAGHHCAQPLMARLGLPATARASLALYNTREEIDALVAALHGVSQLFNRS